MHPFEMPQEYVERMISRQGRQHTCETFDGSKTALVVIDMQNYFMIEPYPAACRMMCSNRGQSVLFWKVL